MPPLQNIINSNGYNYFFQSLHVMVPLQDIFNYIDYNYFFQSLHVMVPLQDIKNLLLGDGYIFPITFSIIR